MSIEFTQFLLPHGRKEKVTIERSKEVEEKAAAIVRSGYRFEIEQLNTGMVSMSIDGFIPEIEEDGYYHIKHCKNGPEVPNKVDELVTEGYAKLEAEGRLK